jgi:hypothetical protein
MTPEQVAKDNDQQPEAGDEHKHGENVGQKIGKSESTFEGHRRSSLVTNLCILIALGASFSNKKAPARHRGSVQCR